MIKVYENENYFKDKTGEGLYDVYNKYHPQILSDFGEELETYWGRKWKANSKIGKLRSVLLHRPGKEFLSVGKPTPWPPHDSSLGAWRMSELPNLDELIEHHEKLVKAYKDEGIEVVIRKPDPNNPPYQVKSIYTADVCFPAVYGMVLLRMVDYIRKGEEVPTYQTLAEIGCPVVGMILGNGMVEGGPIIWLDEKHVVVSIHTIRANTSQPEIWRANEFGHEQYARIVKLQDPEVDVRVDPGYGYREGIGRMIDRHTSCMDPKLLSPRFVDYLKSEMNWEFIIPPAEICEIRMGEYRGADIGICLEPMKILRPTGDPKATKWFESIGVEVVEVDVGPLTRPRGSGGMKCTYVELIRDPEPKSY